MFVDQYLANVTAFAGNFAPRGWLLCNGQLLSIAQNTALFALIGTIYGGNGQTTFALPDLRGRAALHPGTGPGLSFHDLGEQGGNETITITNNQLPAHTHAFTSATGGQAASAVAGTTDIPTNNYPAPVNGSGNAYSTSPSTAKLGASTFSTNTAITGGSQPVTILSPYLALNFIIAVEGIFPSRN